MDVDSLIEQLDEKHRFASNQHWPSIYIYIVDDMGRILLDFKPEKQNESFYYEVPYFYNRIPFDIKLSAARALESFLVIEDPNNFIIASQNRYNSLLVLEPENWQSNSANADADVDEADNLDNWLEEIAHEYTLEQLNN